jgi:fido (protein-threonine AMPylation protein)
LSQDADNKHSNDEALRAALTAREGELVANRIAELHESPIEGNFDADHLKAIHAYIFQDMPHHQPGVTRADSDGWVKRRVLEGEARGYQVHYASDNIDGKMTRVLDDFGGPTALASLPIGEAARHLTRLYGDLDYVHGFHEGNSRTLREFTRELADKAGFKLDWAGTGAGREERNALSVARDIEVIQRRFPGLTHERGMATNDRSKYEASYILETLQHRSAGRTLETIVLSGLSDSRQRQQREGVEDNHEARSLKMERGRAGMAEALGRIAAQLPEGAFKAEFAERAQALLSIADRTVEAGPCA